MGDWAAALPGDIAAGVIAGACVAPIVSNVDKAIAEASSGRASMWPSFFASCKELVVSPVKYFRQPAFYYLWLMYAGTYATANSFSSAEQRSWQETRPMAKTWTIFGVNFSLTLMKDMAFARIFGTKTPTNVPKTAMACWFARDLLAMGGIFVAPPLIAERLHLATGLDQQRAEVMAQLSVPILMQPISTPLHLGGYQIYNQPQASFMEHMRAMRKVYLDAIAIRCIRMFPPYSVGTLFNKALRRRIHEAQGLS